MVYTGSYSPYYLEHHGILGQKWGIRRYQNPDGTLTAEGKVRYYKKETNKNVRKTIKNVARAAVASSLIGTATNGPEFILNASVLTGNVARNIAKALGEDYISAAAFGLETSANVASALNGIGGMALTATTVVGLASVGFAAYRAGKAIYSGIEKAKAEKEYTNSK